MRREAIAVDVDDVLAAHVPSFIAFSNENYGTNLTPDEYSDHWADLWHVDYDEIERRAAEFHVPERVLAYELILQSDAAIKELSTMYDLYIVTARGKNMLDVTLRWMDTYFKGIFKGVHFVPIWEPNNAVTKADICRQIGADYLIDDLPRHCNVAAQAGIRALLYGDYNWNRNEEIEDGVTRVKDWPAVLEYFSGIR